MFYRSLSPTEQAHVAAAYTFELAKCFEQTVRERQLVALANIDEQLCQTVAQGLGLPVPKATGAAADERLSPALRSCVTSRTRSRAGSSASSPTRPATLGSWRRPSSS